MVLNAHRIVRRILQPDGGGKLAEATITLISYRPKSLSGDRGCAAIERRVSCASPGVDATGQADQGRRTTERSPEVKRRAAVPCAVRGCGPIGYRGAIRSNGRFARKGTKMNKSLRKGQDLLRSRLSAPLPERTALPRLAVFLTFDVTGRSSRLRIEEIDHGFDRIDAIVIDLSHQSEHAESAARHSDGSDHRRWSGCLRVTGRLLVHHQHGDGRRRRRRCQCQRRCQYFQQRPHRGTKHRGSDRHWPVLQCGPWDHRQQPRRRYRAE